LSEVWILTKPKTIIEKIWDKKKVHEEAGKPDLIYIDFHLIHEVTSPQAFEGLRLTNRKVRRPDLTFATMDHNVPTINRENVKDEISKKQMDTLQDNCKEFGIELADMFHPDQGIVHIIGPQLGLTQPGKTIVCGDSHTSTHGAFGAIAFGIGTSEVEHVFATQTLWQERPKTLNVKVDGEIGYGVTAKDLILAIIAKYGVRMGNGHIVEYTGEAIRNMTMEERMTVCNMSIEEGARAGLISPDETTVEFLRGKRYAPKGEAFEKASAEWLALATDEGAEYDNTLTLDASQVERQVTWGTNPGMGEPVSGSTPIIAEQADQAGTKAALEYMGLEENVPMQDIQVDHIFIGSCTNARLPDLRSAAKIVKGEKVKDNIESAIIVHGSSFVKNQAEEEGLDQIFKDAGFEWRNAGCSACLGMNDDIIPPKGRCASTSNRNFEGRQGNEARTHLVSPEMAAATAIEGKFVDVRHYA